MPLQPLRRRPVRPFQASVPSGRRECTFVLYPGCESAPATAPSSQQQQHGMAGSSSSSRQAAGNKQQGGRPSRIERSSAGMAAGSAHARGPDRRVAFSSAGAYRIICRFSCCRQRASWIELGACSWLKAVLHRTISLPSAAFWLAAVCVSGFISRYDTE
jgi:hypothetical protein